MKKTYKILIFLLFFGFVSMKPAYAQDDFREKLQEIKLEKLTKKLELDDNTKTVFMDKYKAFAADMKDLNKKRAKAYKLMTENIESGNGLDSIVNQLLDYEEQINNKREAFVTDMRSILTSQQIAKMIVFERKFNNEIKKLLKQYQKNNNKEKPFKE
ncbi:MAG TPA: hypothetical protein VG961_05960 [Ignavibacteria bacterium]|nr:hypothetical protein [Ignavibacteria bacterium]